MTDELPPAWALNKAAKAIEGEPWERFWSLAPNNRLRASIIAHARTIAQYEQPPVDEDEEALLRVLKVWEGVEDRAYLLRCNSFPAALAQFKRELEGRK